MARRRATAIETCRPGRPLGFDRRTAVRAAMDLFWRRGYLAVTASDLAQAMDLQRSSFYNSFGTREQVFGEALSLYRAEAPDAALDRLRPGDPVVPAILALFHEACRACAADEQARGCLVCNAVGELVAVDDEVGPAVEAAIQARISSFERLLRQAAAQGEIAPPGNVKATARAIMAFLVGLNTMSKVVRNERQLWAMSRAFLQGIGIADDQSM